MSLKTIHNWVDAAKEGKVNLQLHEYNGKTYIANTASNVTALERQAEKGKKYRNSLHQKIVKPSPEFYKLFSQRQILDIISNLSIHHEIPRQYNYIDKGASNWAAFSERIWQEESPSLIKSTVELLQLNFQAIDSLIETAERVNVIDLGPGNGLPVKELLAHLLERNQLHRYIAIDISEEMLNIAKNNISLWFGKRVKFEGYVRDMTSERFDDVIVEDMLDKSATKTTNLVLLLGATPMNFRTPADALRFICSSMDQNDLLAYTDKPDTEAERRYFDFNPKPGITSLSPNHRLIFDLFDIDDSLYEVEMGFNEQEQLRFIRVRLKVGLTIKFRFQNIERDVTFEKGDTILLWRAWHMSTLEIISTFEKSGFTLLQSSLTKDRQFLLTISGVNANPS